MGGLGLFSFWEQLFLLLFACSWIAKMLFYQGQARVEHWCAGDGLLGHHHLDELFVVDLAITINVSLTDHFIDFFVGELLAEVGHDVTKLCSGDEAVAVLVEDLESLKDLLLGVGSFILRAIMVRTSGKSMVPLPSASTPM